MNTKHILLLMAAALMMAACAFEDPMEKQKPWVETDSDAPVPVRFSVSTTNNVDFTRAETSIVTFDTDEHIHVRVKPMGEESYTSYDYTTAGSGRTNVALTAPTPPPYFPAGIHSTVDAYAYYPSTALSEPKFTVLGDQSTPAAYKASDLMMADNRTVTKITDPTDSLYGDGTTHLTMKHLMTQLRIKALPGEDSGITITRIEVEARKSVTFTPEGETIAETAEDVGTVIVRQGEGEGYILIPPQAISGVTIKVVTDDGSDASKTATYAFTADGNFEAGCSYGVDITVIAGQLGLTTAIANWNGLGSVVIAPSGDLVIDPIRAKTYINPTTPVTLTTTGENPDLVVKKGGNKLIEGKDYEVQYIGNNNAGTAYVVVTGKEHTVYEGSIGVAPFTITKNEAATISYAGCPSMEVTYGDEPFVNTHLFNDGDGTITYESSDSTVATVNPYTGQVTIVKPSDDPITITATAADGPNYVYADNARTASYTLHVNKAAGSIAFTTPDPVKAWSATTNENHYTQSVTHTGNAAVTYTLSNNTCGATIDGSTVTYTQAGSVTVTASVEDNDYYAYAEKSVSYTLTVTKAQGYVTIDEQYGNWGSVNFGQTDKMLFGIKASHGGTMTVTSADESVATAYINGGHVFVNGVSVGQTTITVTCAETAQYQAATSEAFTVAVGKVAIPTENLAAPTAVSGQTYTGSAQPLVNAGTAPNGTTMLYSTDGGTNWTADIPTGTNAGTYTVYWKVAGNQNYNDYNSGASISVTIGKADLNPTAPTAKSGLAYTTEQQVLVNAGSVTGGTMQYKVGDNGSWGATAAATDANTYTVYWKVVGDSNHNDHSGASLSVTIGKADLNPTAPTAKSGLTYTGGAQALVDAGSATGGTMQYKVGANGTWGNSLPTGTNASTYTVYWKVVGDSNHNDYSGSSFNVTIDKTDPTYTAPTAKSGLTYTGGAQALVNAGSAPDGTTMQYKVNSGSWSTNVPTETNAGTYTVYWKVVGNDNYNDNNGSSFNVTIGKKTVTNWSITPTNLTIKGSGASDAEKTGTITVSFGDGGTDHGTVSVSGQSTACTTSVSGGDITVTGATAGSATLTVTVAAGTNYTYSGSKTCALTVQATGVNPSSLQLGDIIYVDGTWSRNNARNTSKTAVGVVVYVASSSGDAACEAGKACRSGSGTVTGKVLVMSLQDASGVKKAWFTANSTDHNNTMFPNCSSNKTTASSDYGGYEKTKQMATKTGECASHTHAAATAAWDYVPTGANSSSPYLNGSTGWFLPSIGQWFKVFQAMAGASGVSTTVPNAGSWSSSEIVTTKLRSYISTAGGNVTYLVDGYYYLSSSEYSATSDQGVTWDTGALPGFQWNAGNKTFAGYVRPFLAY